MVEVGTRVVDRVGLTASREETAEFERSAGHPNVRVGDGPAVRVRGVVGPGLPEPVPRPEPDIERREAYAIGHEIRLLVRALEEPELEAVAPHVVGDIVTARERV